MFALPDLPYPENALEPFFDTETMRLHHGKHHASYVDNLNKALESHPELSSKSVEELLCNLDTIPEDIRTKIRNHGGGHYNHTLFWQILTPEPKSQMPAPDSTLTKAMMSAFSSPQTFQEKFSSVALAHFGSGWAWLVIDGQNLEIVDSSNQDTPLSKGKIPLLALDLWEHAYYLKYQNRRAEYISAWWNIINWKKVEENFSAAAR